MQELFRNPYMTATLAGDRVTLAWKQQEPDDDHAVATAQAVVKALESAPAPRPFTVLVDVRPVSRPFPRATGLYARWLVDHRANVRAAAVVASSFLVRTAITAAVVLPGLKVRGFKDEREAEAYLGSA